MRRAVGFAAVTWLALSGGFACSRGSAPSGDPERLRGSGGAAPNAAPGPSSQKPAASDGGARAAKPSPARELTWIYDESPVGPMQVVISIPPRKIGDLPLPVLIAMHGRGEAMKGAARGARGWIDDYGLEQAIERLHSPPLDVRDLQGFADPVRLRRINESLARRPYRGLIVACPYTPDILAGDRPFSAARPLAEFLVDQLLPRIRRETPAASQASLTGIDGVSLGGRAALLVGLARAQSFGAVAGLQAAFDSADAPELAKRAKQATLVNPKLALRLLTSDEDYFLNANRNISRAFEQAGVGHELVVVPGPHDYEFNRGPGAFEMLIFHDRALRGEPAL